jgi:hypothetical protein
MKDANILTKSGDAEVRAILRRLLVRSQSIRTNSLIIEEMGLCQGLARIDLAIISSSIHGFEIKSARDTLDRLEAQIAIYSSVLQRVTIVADAVHMPEVREMVPRWWGLWRISYEQGRLVSKELRQPRNNPRIDPSALVQLLWRDEVIALLDQKKMMTGYRSKPRDVLWDRLIKSVTLTELCCLVARQLKSRPSWRPAHQQA